MLFPCLLVKPREQQIDQHVGHAVLRPCMLSACCMLRELIALYVVLELGQLYLGDTCRPSDKDWQQENWWVSFISAIH